MMEPGAPCALCQVRPDVACRHRPADPNWSMGAAPVETDNRRNRDYTGQGYNFRKGSKGGRPRKL